MDDDPDRCRYHRRGIIPAALEIMDRTTIEAIERGAPAGPRDAEAADR